MGRFFKALNIEYWYREQLQWLLLVILLTLGGLQQVLS